MEIFTNMLNVFNVSFDQFKATMLNSWTSLKEYFTDPKRLNCSLNVFIKHNILNMLYIAILFFKCLKLHI